MKKVCPLTKNQEIVLQWLQMELNTKKVPHVGAHNVRLFNGEDAIKFVLESFTYFFSFFVADRKF